MNVEARVPRPGAQPEPMKPRIVKLTVRDFMLLKEAGTFANFSKSELLDGELWGVPRQEEHEPESDAEYPIKLRVQDYMLLDSAGALEAYSKTELIDGVVYAVSPEYRPHWYIKSEISYRLRRALETLGSDLYVGDEGSVLFSDTDMPQPDIIVTREPRGEGPIPAASVTLLVEISGSTHDHDFGLKATLYARHGVPEYWIADLRARVIHRMWTPRAGEYANRDEVRFGNRIEAATIAGLAVETDSLD